jgi:hypothetical protein
VPFISMKGWNEVTRVKLIIILNNIITSLNTLIQGQFQNTQMANYLFILEFELQQMNFNFRLFDK